MTCVPAEAARSTRKKGKSFSITDLEDEMSVFERGKQGFAGSVVRISLIRKMSPYRLK